MNAISEDRWLPNWDVLQSVYTMSPQSVRFNRHISICIKENFILS